MSQSAEHANIPVRPVFNTLPSYAAGKPPAPVEGLTQYKLSSNENPLGPVPEVARVLAEFATAHRYPDPLSTALRHKLSARLGVDADDIVTGAGSLGALNQILKTFAGVNADGVQDEVIYAWRSFEAYPILVGIMGARSVQVPNLPDGSHDLDAMAAAITNRTRLILVCTPNNPTGPAVTERRIRAFLAKVPAHIHLVDERERVTARLRELGYDFPSTYANFVWLPLGERTGEFVQLMAEHALSVRAFGTEGVRVSIGEVEANDRFLSLCEVFAKGL